MPLYEYQCPKDGSFELVRKFSDPPLLACPTCGGPIEKLVSAPAIQFKGSGWYITDYARKGGDAGKKDADASGKKEAAGADKASADATKSAASDSTSSENKSSASSTSTDKK